jgi:hypothetical protein
MKQNTLTDLAVEFLDTLSHWFKTNPISQGIGFLISLLVLGIMLFSCGAAIMALFRVR